MRCDCTFTDDGNASWYSVCRGPMVEWRLDCENCRHLTVVGLHDTDPWSPFGVWWQNAVVDNQCKTKSGHAVSMRSYSLRSWVEIVVMAAEAPIFVYCWFLELKFMEIKDGGSQCVLQWDAKSQEFTPWYCPIKQWVRLARNKPWPCQAEQCLLEGCLTSQQHAI